jgi:RNA polymerase sigma factor (sigma-70 family)
VRDGQVTGTPTLGLQPARPVTGPLFMNDESALVRRVVAGEEAAFRTLVERYERLVAHVVGRIVEDSDRDDVGQEVFVKVYRGLHSFRGEARLSTWIARVAVHTALNHAEKRRPAATARLGDHASLHLAAPDILPDARMAANERDHFVRFAIATLPATYRVALTLFHLDGFSHAEIAEALDMPLGSVKSNLFRARRRLKEALLATHPAEEWDLTDT